MAAPTNGTFTSGSLTLGSYLALPAIRTQAPAVIMCHGFPIGPLDARQSALTFPQLMDRLAAELGWAALTFTFRGCGTSEGDFSMQGWVDDLRAAIDHVERETNPSGIWLVGTNTGGSLALCVAAYALSPIDLIPDFIPVIGYLDDLLIVPLGLLLVIRLTPEPVLAAARLKAEAALSRPRSYTAAAVFVLIWIACALGFGYWLSGLL